MNRDALISDLGTIARSGTSAYLEEHADEEGVDLGAIGQFGVGFYSAFMVASDVEVISRRAGRRPSLALVVRRHRRVHDRGRRTRRRGTTIRLNLRKGEEEFLEESRLRHIVKTYSDHRAAYRHCSRRWGRVHQ